MALWYCGQICKVSRCQSFSKMTCRCSRTSSQIFSQGPGLPFEGHFKSLLKTFESSMEFFALHYQLLTVAVTRFYIMHQICNLYPEWLEKTGACAGRKAADGLWSVRSLTTMSHMSYMSYCVWFVCAISGFSMFFRHVLGPRLEEACHTESKCHSWQVKAVKAVRHNNIYPLII